LFCAAILGYRKAAAGSRHHTSLKIGFIDILLREDEWRTERHVIAVKLNVPS
jgi:hypothetical protein